MAQFTFGSRLGEKTRFCCNRCKQNARLEIKMGNFYAKIYCRLSPALKALNSQARFDNKSYEEDLLASVWFPDGNPSSRLFTKSFSDFLTTSALADLTCDIKCQLAFF